MSKQKKGGFSELLFKTIMPKVYGIGASVVIIGALFKIQHLPGAGAMLGIGLSVEAVIFFLSAFEPPHKDPDWSKVYPELADDYSGPANAPRIANAGKGDNVAQKLDHMLESAKIGPELIESLGKGMQNLANNTKQLATASDAVVKTQEYTKNVEVATKNLSSMSNAYSSATSAIQKMSEATGNAKEYNEELGKVTTQLKGLNAMYDTELKNSDSHLKAMNKFYGNMASVMENMEKAGKGTEKFSQEMQKLTGNLTSLNSIYGSMLTAMKGGGPAA